MEGGGVEGEVAGEPDGAVPEPLPRGIIQAWSFDDGDERGRTRGKGVWKVELAKGGLNWPCRVSASLRWISEERTFGRSESRLLRLSLAFRHRL